MPSIVGAQSSKAKPRQRAGKPARAKQTGSQIVYDALRYAIIALAIEPGSILEETVLCRQYKVSRTPVREALIRLSSEGLVELQPNRGASVATLQFIDVVDHYEAMEIFQPITCHFAAVRGSPADIKTIKAQLAKFCRAVEGRDYEGIIRFNYDLHSAIATASHNRCIERGYRQMLVDKLRIAQHGLPSASRNRAAALADRFSGTVRISRQLVEAIARGAAQDADRIARALNEYVRAQVVAHFSVDLAHQVTMPTPQRRAEPRGTAGQIVKLHAKRSASA
ncbi:MAG TPA: GntR family transcriptional regulator [Stellaceae bacterium]|nr:GntR family transcriptional regulator [Stellaceae bacterium]